MLKTIYLIGKETSEGRDIWEDIIESKKINLKEDISYYTLNLVFDLDDKKIYIPEENLKNYEESLEYKKELMYLQTLGRNMKSPYLCVDTKKIENLYKSLFGKLKNNKTPPIGDLGQIIELEFPKLKETIFYKILLEIRHLRNSFEDIFKNNKNKFTIENCNKSLQLNKKNKIVLITPYVNSKKLNINNLQLSSMEQYSILLRKKFLEKKPIKNQETKLCYATGLKREDVKEVSFTERYNINKFFVKETKNFAPSFNPKNFHKNYQVSEEFQTYLDRGSKYLLENLSITIADVRHVIIPHFFNNNSKITSKRLKDILSDTDLLFSFKKFEALNSYFESKENEYWVNFLAIDSDGNYFKVKNQIKDISSFHFTELSKTLRLSGKELSPWLGDQVLFNLNQMHRLIPKRKDEKINQALLLFSAILENRPIEIKKIYRHFTEAILCHWYQRYKSYTNIRNNYQEFDFALKDTVYGYLAFINTLKRLNLIKKSPPMKKSQELNDISKEVELFFNTMEYSQEQISLFYLGRALNQVAFAQKEKGNKKTILEKLNYNGMDKKSLLKISIDLFEKAKQYEKFSSNIEWPLSKFNKRFSPNNWNMNPQEALFFILSGYTFRITATKNTEE